jgi:hypothetical protein
MGGNGKSDNQNMTSAMSENVFGAAFPAFEGAMGMFTDAINSGGVQSRQPLYSQAAEKSLQASNQAQIKMGEDFDRTGISGTPFAETAMRKTKQQGQLGAARAPMEMENQDYWKILTTMFPGAQSGTTVPIQSMTALTGMDAQLTGDLLDFGASFFDTSMGGIQSMAKG